MRFDAQQLQSMRIQRDQLMPVYMQMDWARQIVDQINPILRSHEEAESWASAKSADAKSSRQFCGAQVSAKIKPLLKRLRDALISSVIWRKMGDV